MSRIFITGGTGYIGRNLLKVLQNNGTHQIRLFKRGEDITSMIKYFQPEIIYHLAGETKHEEKMYDSNFILTRDMVEASNDILYESFIYIGSSSEYGKKRKPMKETDSCKPTTIYSETKNLATECCRFYANLLKKNIIILRPFSVYGNDEPEGRFIPRLIKSCLFDEEIDLWEGNHDWVHVEDIISALLVFVYKKLPGEIVNIGTGIETSNFEVLKIVEGLTGKKANVKRHKGLFKKTDSNRWVADISKALALGWKPTVTLEEGIRREIDEIERSIG